MAGISPAIFIGGTLEGEMRTRRVAVAEGARIETVQYHHELNIESGAQVQRA
jgi:hypothetical protein